MAVRMVYLKDKEAVKMGCRETKRAQHRCDKRCLWLEWHVFNCSLRESVLGAPFYLE